MNSSRFFELIADPSSTYLAQASLGFVMYLIFRHFSQIYIRRFLKSWARGWLAFSVQMMAVVIIMARPEANPWPLPVRIFLEVIVQLGSFLHIIFILLGTYQLVRNRPVNRKLYQLIVFLAVVVAFLTSVEFSLDTPHASEYYAIRIGSRCFISGLGFFLASYVVWRNPKFTRGVGQKMLAFSLLAFSAYQFFYLFLVLSDLPGEQALQPGARGLINLVMIAIMSMSMSIWLLEDEREKLQQSNRDLDSFIYSTSHDLRAPITSILGLTYLGKVELGEEKAHHYMDLIEQRVKKLNMILTDILRLSKTKKFDIQIKPVDFNEVIKEAISDIDFNTGSASIRFAYEPRTDNICHTDYSQLSIVLANLITNAVKYHRLNQDDPFVKVSFERVGQHVTISVEDNGQGIPPQSVHKIFDMFYRANQQTEGTGLGLYIVKEALSKIKGKIEVSSVFGKGTTFIVQLENV